MPKFITIGYGDQAGYDRTPEPIRDAAHQQDAKLRSVDLAAAVEKVSRVPCAVAHGVVEVWPLKESH